MAFAGVQAQEHGYRTHPGRRILHSTSQQSGGTGRAFVRRGACAAPDAPAGSPDRSVPIKALAADSGYRNITVQVQPIKGLELPSNADLVWTSNNYHDVHNVPGIDIPAFNKAVWAALKPGGVYLVIDHTASANAPADVTSTLHRIRPETVIQEVTAAGFTLEAQSSVLHNAADSHD